MRRKHAILTKGKRAFAGVMAAAMLAATAAPAAYAEELPAVQPVAEETTQQETQDFEESASEAEDTEQVDSAADYVQTEDTAADSEETADSAEESTEETAEDTAAEEIKALQARIDALPTAEEFEALADGTTVEDSTLNQAQTDVYNEAQAIADALEQLSEEEQEQIDTAKLEALFDFVNGQVAVMDENTRYDKDFSNVTSLDFTMLDWSSGMPDTDKTYKAGSGEIRWDASAKKLTLENATVKIKRINGNGAIQFPSGSDVTVDLIGENTFTDLTGANGGYQTQGFFTTPGKLTFTGAGSLTIDGVCQGMTVYNGGKISFEQTGKIAITARDCGIQQKGDIEVKSGELAINVYRASTNVWGIEQYPSGRLDPGSWSTTLTINGGRVEVHADNVTGSNSGGIYAVNFNNSSVLVHGGELVVTSAQNAIRSQTITIDGEAKVTASSTNSLALSNCTVSGNAVVNATTENNGFAINLDKISGNAKVTGSGNSGGVSVDSNTFAYDGNAVIVSRGNTAKYGAMSGDLQTIVKKTNNTLKDCKITVAESKGGENATVWDWDYTAHPLNDSTYKYIKIEKCTHSGAQDDGDCTTAVYCPDCGGTHLLLAAQTQHNYTSTWTDEGNGVHSLHCTNTLYDRTQCQEKITVSAPNVNATYDGNPHQITVTAPKGATVKYKNSGTYTPVNPSYTNAGTYTVEYNVTGNDYTLESSATVTIAPVAITAVVSAEDKEYDGNTNANVTATVDTGIAGETLTISGLSGTFDNKNVGENKTVIVDSEKAAVTAGANTSADNYTVTYADTTTANITAKPVTVTITPNGGIYGETITPATATANDVVSGENPTITLTYTGTANDGTKYNNTEAPTKAGTYTVTATTTDPNYTLDATTTTAEFTIAKRPATVTPEDKSKVYEEKDPELTYTVDGVLDNEELTDITLTRAVAENAGEYAITGKADAAANPNYNVTFAEGKFTIKPKLINNATVKLGAGLTANGAKQTQTVEKVLLDGKELPADSYTVTGNTATAPGSYKLTITGKGNYTGSIEWKYVIAPAKAEDAPGADIVIGSGTVKVAVKSEGNVPTTTLLTDKAELLAMLVDNGDITADELAQIANGASVDIVLTVKEANVTDETKAAMAQAAKGYTIGQYLDINLFKYMTVNGVAQDGVALHTTKNALTISVKVPDALINTNGAYNRSYCIVRYHDNTATVPDAAFDATNKTLTFKTDRFSDYAIAYKDTAVPSSDTNTSSNENKQTEAAPTPTPAPASTAAPSTMTRVPKTGDTSNPMLYAVLLVVSLFGLAATFVCKRRNNK